MAFTNTKENGLESLIVKWLVEQNGYEEGTNADYNKNMLSTRLACSGFCRIRSQWKWTSLACSLRIRKSDSS